MYNNKYDIRQAVKACLINYLEDKYQQSIEQAIFAAQISEEVTLLMLLKEKHIALKSILEEAIKQELDKAAFSVPQDIRYLTPEQEQIVDAVVDNSTNTDILLLVNDCKQLLSI